MFVRLLTFGLVAASTLGGAFASSNLPILDLPYGRWRAAKYDQAADVRRMALIARETHYVYTVA